jgi:opacity protein-like surface antigen
VKSQCWCSGKGPAKEKGHAAADEESGVRKEIQFVGVFGVVTLLFLLISSTALAVDAPWSFEIYGSLNPWLSGKAGDTGGSNGTIDYDDAFLTGVGVGGELSYRFLPRFSALIGIGYQRFKGKDTNGLDFDNFHVLPVYGGGKFHFLPNSRKWDLYLRADLGGAYLDGVDANGSPYWDSGWVFYFAGGGGVMYNVWDNIGIGIEAKAQYLGEPDSKQWSFSDADGSWTVPLRLGVSYHF